MKQENKKYNLYCNLIKIILFFLLSSLFLLLSYQYLNSALIPLNNYCYNHYHNDSFMDNFSNDYDPITHINCDSTKDRIGWYQFCNSSCREKVIKCRGELSSDERKFMESCSWGASAMTTGGMLFLISLLGIFLFLFIQEIKKLKEQKALAHKTPKVRF